MRAIYLLLIFLVAFGCIEDSNYSGLGNENVMNTVSEDIDGDGISDYVAITYSPFEAGNMKVQRFVTVSTKTRAEYTALDSNLTDVDLLFADSDLDEFSQSRIQADAACSKNIGILNVVCSDITTCSRLCSSTTRCRSIAEDFDEVLTDSMITYVQDNTELRSLILDSRRMVLGLRNQSIEEKNEFLQITRDMVSRVSSINSNPLYNNLNLCSYSDFGTQYAISAAKKLGEYSTSVEGYEYTVVILMSPQSEEGTELISAGITDHVRFIEPDDVFSIQKIDVTKNADTVIVWNSRMPNKNGYMVGYEFSSNKPPEELLNAIERPEIRTSNIGLGGFFLTSAIFDIVQSILGNYFLSLGFAIGITIAILLLIYNIIILAFVLVSERAAGATFTAGFRRAFGRTAVTWKSDIVIAIVFLAIGFYVSEFLSDQPTTIPPITETFETLIKSELGILGFGLSAIGILMLYLAFENLTKITILERAYGMVIRHEKDMYMAKAAKLEEKIQELADLINQYTKENFEFSREYDILTSAKGLDVKKLSSKITAQTKSVIDDNLASVEGAIKSLNEKKASADTNWPAWSDSITKILDEQNEVYSASLMTIPASLRIWALNKYATEHEDVSLDHDGLKRKTVSVDNIIHGLIVKDLVEGILVIRHDKIEMSEFSEGSGTVKKALALKLRNYIKSLAKKLGQHDPQSFVCQGNSKVIVYMKGKASESVLFVRKERFNEAIEKWKAKMKIIDQ